jgi:hypothetical protein
MSITITEAQAREWPEIIIGNKYEFVSEMEQEYLPAEERMNRYTGQTVTVLREQGPDERDAETGRGFHVRADDGEEFVANEEEINGWDKALGQFFGPSGIYGDMA